MVEGSGGLLDFWPVLAVGKVILVLKKGHVFLDGKRQLAALGE
jgi:hypothetical protein